MQPLVIKEWKANNCPVDQEGNFIRITGRQAGALAWLLSLLKIDPITSLKVSPERVEFSSASLSGTTFRMIPILGVCSSYYGYSKPWKAALFLFVVFLLLAITIAVALESALPALVISLVGALAAIVYYFLSRSLTLGFVEHSGVVNGIVFKRSVIEGVDINEAQGAYICKLAQFLIEARGR